MKAQKQVHGNHWDCFVGNTDEAMKEILPKIVEEGNLAHKAEVYAHCLEDESPSQQTVFSISIDTELSAKALIVPNTKQNRNEVVTVYPIAKSSNSVHLKITKIEEWDNLIEAVITGETSDGLSISFFDVDYYANKHLYQIGNSYDFAIVSFGYNAEILQETTFSFEGQTAIDYLAKIGKKPTYDKQGNVEPVKFDLSNLVAYIPSHDYPDEAEFQSPIHSIEEVSVFNRDFYKISITIHRDPDLHIDVFVKTSMFKEKPLVHEPIRGVMWTQGYVKTDNNPSP